MDEDLLKKIRAASLADLTKYEGSAEFSKRVLAVIGIICWIIILASEWSMLAILPLGFVLYYISNMHVTATNILTEVRTNISRHNKVD